MRCQPDQSTLPPAKGFLRANKLISFHHSTGFKRSQAGLTLVEVVISTAITAVVFGGILSAYIQSGLRLKWTGYSLAAESLAIQTIEQARSAVWDPAQIPPVNQLNQLNLSGTNYNSTTMTYSGYTVGILDIPYQNTNYIMATNFISVQLVNVSGNVQGQVVRVDTVWPFAIRSGTSIFTNTICTIVAPDNRDPSTF